MGISQRFSELRSRCLGEAGRTTVDLRRLVHQHAKDLRESRTSSASNELGDTLARWTEKIALRSYEALDRDIAALQDEGYSDLEIFELTASAALGAAEVGLTCGLQSIEEAADEPAPVPARQ